MPWLNPKLFAACVAMVVAPPLLLVVLRYPELLRPKPIDPRMAVGEVLFFQNRGCGACQAMKPVVTRLRDEGFMIRPVDVASHEQQAIDYGISVVPTFILLRDGQEVRRTSGMISPESLRQMWR